MQNPGMIPGSLRYPRLGNEPNVEPARAVRWDVERALGVDFAGKLKSRGGTGITIGAQPSTILAGMLGSIVGSSVAKSTTKGVIFGFLGGAVVATALRWSESIGF